jgi:hypothetical protein
MLSLLRFNFSYIENNFTENTLYIYSSLSVKTDEQLQLGMLVTIRDHYRAYKMCTNITLVLNIGNKVIFDVITISQNFC